MDGPASIVIKRVESSICIVECIWNNTVEFTAELDDKIIYEEVVHSARLIENICKTNSWNDDDVVKMRKLLH